MSATDAKKLRCKKPDGNGVAGHVFKHFVIAIVVLLGMENHKSLHATFIYRPVLLRLFVMRSGFEHKVVGHGKNRFSMNYMLLAYRRSCVHCQRRFGSRHAGRDVPVTTHVQFYCFNLIRVGMSILCLYFTPTYTPTRARPFALHESSVWLAFNWRCHFCQVLLRR